MNEALFAAVLLAVVAGVCHAETMVYDFEGPDGLPAIRANAAAVALVPSPTGKGQALQVTFEPAEWPAVVFPVDGSWDWSDYAGLAVDVTNPESQDVQAFLRVDNEGATDTGNWNASATHVPAGQTATLFLRFNVGRDAGLWGMRGYPTLDDIPAGPAFGSVIDPSEIVAFMVAIQSPKKDRTLLFDNFRVWGRAAGGPVKAFVDEFGQYALQQWPGKVNGEQDLAARREAELEELDQRPVLPDRDEYGGWAAGPKLDATGWFRTENVDGKWWLVTPKGSLFFSNGIDCINLRHSTFITKREDYFQWLPERDGRFKEHFGFSRHVHSNAEPIKDTGGETFDFYQANLLRKYGEDWRQQWMNVAFRRMRAWGFNTVANWSDPPVLEASPHPFVATVWVPDQHRRVEGGGGYWSKIHDPYDPAFERDVDRGMAHTASLFGQNPLCIGYFVDNELAWGGDGSFDIAVGALTSPPDQPCRQAFLAMLDEEYGTPEAVNSAWGTHAAGWDELRAPDEKNAACREDLNAFIRQFSLRYFHTVAAAVRKHAPNQLYLGCRFAWRNSISVKACAEVADVVSFNIYKPRVDPEEWGFANDLGKPCIIGEFHVGATDRGMLHPGLVPARDQTERAQMYVDYVNSVADSPALVGCHWFQYVDQPLTGRSFDGENYNVGLVTVTDTPYAELIEAARKVHSEVYERRYGGAAGQP